MTFSNLFVVISQGNFHIILVPSLIYIILAFINAALTAIIEEIIFRHFLFKEFKHSQSTLKSIKKRIFL